MTTLTLFLLGSVVTILAVAGLTLVGLSEAADPDHSRAEDLTEWEWSLVRGERAKLAADRRNVQSIDDPRNVA